MRSRSVHARLRLLAGLLIVLALESAAQLPPDASFQYSAESTRLRRDLLAAYDKHAVPPSNRSANLGVTFSAAGTDVELSLRIFKVVAVKAAEGSMQLKVWLRMTWQDLRLSWNPADYGGITKTFFWGDPSPGGVGSEIWTPDVQPYAWVAFSKTGPLLSCRPLALTAIA